MNGKRNHRTQPQGLVLFFEKNSKQCLFKKRRDTERNSLFVPKEEKAQKEAQEGAYFHQVRVEHRTLVHTNPVNNAGRDQGQIPKRPLQR